MMILIFNSLFPPSRLSLSLPPLPLPPRTQTTIGALATAAHCFGVCRVKAEADRKEGKRFQGISNHFIEIPVNMRQRVDPPLGPRTGFYVGEVG